MAAGPTSPRRDLFGDVAVALGMLTWAQVRDILKRQVKYRELGIPIRIGELSIEMGLLNQSQCNQILSAQREKRKDREEEKKPQEEEEAELQDPEEGEPVQLGHFKLTKRLGGVMG